jgi:hypothetical protein
MKAGGTPADIALARRQRRTKAAPAAPLCRWLA